MSFGFQDLLFLGKFGDNGPEGNNTVFNLPTITAIKQHNIQMNQAADPEVSCADVSFSGPPYRLSSTLPVPLHAHARHCIVQ
jgi:hypothetical protein